MSTPSSTLNRLTSWYEEMNEKLQQKLKFQSQPRTDSPHTAPHLNHSIVVEDVMSGVLNLVKGGATASLSAVGAVGRYTWLGAQYSVEDSRKLYHTAVERLKGSRTSDTAMCGDKGCDHCG